MPDAKKAPIALITGGSRGLGRSMALHLAGRGVDIILTYRAAVAEAREVCEQVRAFGRKAVALKLDVIDSASFDDFLVNNAGTSLHASIAETTEAQLDEVYTVHFKAPFLLTQRLLPLIADGGRIINVSSGLARMTMPGSSAYGAMKAAVETFTRYAAKELAGRKITANVIAPGAIATDFSGGRVRDNPEINKMVVSMTALGRVGLPEDIGGAVAMLLAPESGWINGQRIEASGGMNL
jgi:NAD(P)-dependent dehydrogenase (short-subunit alcohol dehydrogenase family)